MFSISLLILTSTIFAQNPPLCDKYTTALFKDNTDENQLKLLTTLVNTVIIGNYTPSKTGEPVPGILSDTEFQGQKMNLLPLFTGKYKSTNVNNEPTSVNFLDGGGAAPLKENKASDKPGTKQDLLLNHLYQVFGGLLGCSKQGSQIYPSYQGVKSMYETHKFMNINKKQLMFFEEQVGKAAMSLGVSQEDATAVGQVLGKTFNVQCSAPIQLAGLDGSQGFCNTWDCDSAQPRMCPADFGKATAEGVQQAAYAPQSSATGHMSYIVIVYLFIMSFFL